MFANPPHRPLTKAIAGLLIAMSTPAGFGGEPGPVPPPAREAALAVADAMGVAAPRVLNTTPVTHRRAAGAYAMKVLDEADGTIRIIVVDERGGDLDSEGVLAVGGERGALGPALVAALRRDPAAPQRVMLWIGRDPVPWLPRPEADATRAMTEMEIGALAAQARLASRASVQRRAALVAAVLRRHDAAFTHDPTSPVMHARLTPAAIDAVAALPEVDRIDLDMRLEPQLKIARQAVRAHRVQGLGIDGRGARVGVIEIGGKFKQNNPFLQAGITQAHPMTSLSDHTTAVVGIIRNSSDDQVPIAPRAKVWVGGSAEGFQSELHNRADAAVAWGAHVLNLSFGGDSGRSVDSGARFFDDLVFTQRVSVVVAAGNEGNGTGNVMSPGLAYNVATVGNFNDRNTISWSDDEMSPSSSFRDPTSTHGDREKPDLVAPGTGLASTTHEPPWTGLAGSGTSFSAPIVTGAVALLMDRAPGLRSWPESVRAILMAAALNNLQGGARLSNRDGAGGLDAKAADQIARRVNGGWLARRYDCDRPANWRVKTVSLVKNETARIAIAWSTDPDDSSYFSQPSADLDLVIRDANGTVVATSSSFDNTFEIVRFTPETTGAYDICVERVRCDADPGGLGIAWYQN